MRLKMKAFNQDKTSMGLRAFFSFIVLSFLPGQSFSQCSVPLNLNTPLTQGFNSSSIPVCWTQQYVNGSSNCIFGGQSLGFSTSGNSGHSTRLVTRVLSSSTSPNIFVEFDWLNQNDGGFSSYSSEGIQVQYSFDSVNWVSAGSFIRRMDDALPPYSEQWKKKTVDLSTAVGYKDSLYVGFRFTSQGSIYSMQVDNLKISDQNPDCPSSIVTSVSENCPEFSLNNGTRTELKVMNAFLADVNYVTTKNSVVVGQNSSGSGQGNGNGVSVSFIPETANYTITASKTGCPSITQNRYVQVPTVSTLPTLVSGGIVCPSNPNVSVSLQNSESGTKYYLLQNGSSVSSEYQGNGGEINFGDYPAGNYSLKAWKCGSANTFFGNLAITDKLSLPASEGFNSVGLPNCWTEENITGTTSSIYPANTEFPSITPQEGSHYIVFQSQQSGNEKRLFSPKLSSVSYPSVNLEFYLFNENLAAFSNSTEGLQVQYSLDGTTWQNVGSFLSRHDATLPLNGGQWKKKIVVLPQAAGLQNVLYIAFRFRSAYNHYVALDNVRITNTLFPLPVRIETFSGKKVGKNVLLGWKVNCDNSSSTVKFDIERSANGRLFSSIHSFTAAAARCVQPFDFTDRNPQKGINYYRIRITEDNGKKTYTAIVAVANNDKGFELVSLVPSPTRGPSNLNISAAEKTRLDLVVYDMQGRTVQKMTKPLEAGSNTIPVNFSSLPGGVYRLNGYAPDGTVKTLVFVKE